MAVSLARLIVYPIGVVCASLLAAAAFAQQFFTEPELRHFYVWDFLTVWGWESLFLTSCYGLGRPLRRLMFKGRSLQLGESLMWTFVLGIIAWVLSFMLAGAIGLYKPWFAVVFPVAVSLSLIVHVWKLLKSRRLSFGELRFTSTEVLVAGFAVLALGFVYFPLLSAGSVATDAAWFHLSSAEDYAREGRLVSLSGDYAKCLPQLTSILHVYAFLVPGLPETQCWVLAMHTEFMVFIITLLSVNVATRYLLGNRPLQLAFAAFFLFPFLYIYDANLGGTADHIVALFAIPQLLSALMALEEGDRRLAFISGTCAGAALLTKLQAAYIIAPLCLWFGLIFIKRSIKQRKFAKKVVVLGLMYMCGATIVFAPHCIKNLIFYHNPIYPLMMDFFPSRPSFHDAGQLFKEHYPPFEQPDLWLHLKSSLAVAFTHPFTLANVHFPRRPFIGALFVLLTPLLCLSRSFRQWGMLLVSWGAILYWAFAFPAPRNMHGFFPLLVALTAVGLYRAWSQGWVTRLLVSSLVFFQLATSFDHIIIVNEGIIRDVSRLIQSGTKALAATRFAGYRADFRGVRNFVPQEGVVLLHSAYSQLGINRRVVLDWPGFQGRIDYRSARTPRDIFSELDRNGITHILTASSWPSHSRQGDVLWSGFLQQYATLEGQSGVLQIWQMPKNGPAQEEAYQVVVWGLGEYPDGLYPVSDLDQLDEGPVLGRRPHVPLEGQNQVEQLLDLASSAVIGSQIQLSQGTLALLMSRFKLVASYPRYKVYVLTIPRLGTQLGVKRTDRDLYLAPG